MIYPVLIHHCNCHLQHFFSEDMHSLYVELKLLQVQSIYLENALKMIQFSRSIQFEIPYPVSVHFHQLCAYLSYFFYLHCSHRPGVLFGPGSWSMGADGIAACCIVIVLEPGCSNVITGTPAALYPTEVLFAFIPSCTALCISRRLDFLNLWLQ